MRINLFKHRSSQSVLMEAVAMHESVWGYKTWLAHAAGCQKSYISQALAGQQELRLEHMIGLIEFWGLSKKERDYLLDLVSFERAGNLPLRVYYLERMNRTLRRLRRRTIELRSGGPLKSVRRTSLTRSHTMRQSPVSAQG